MVSDWPFADPPNVAVFTLRGILEKRDPILEVYHDEEDGGWQFLDGKPFDMDQAMLVGLKEMLRHDPTIAELADLPLGWRAVRSGAAGPWQRSRQPEAGE